VDELAARQRGNRVRHQVQRLRGQSGQVRVEAVAADAAVEEQRDHRRPVALGGRLHLSVQVDRGCQLPGERQAERC
jgi:hypothetical protein